MDCWVRGGDTEVVEVLTRETADVLNTKSEPERQGSLDCCSSRYCSPIHLVWSHDRHTSHCTPRWFFLTGPQQTPHGYLQRRGPGLTSTSPASRSRQMVSRDHEALRCEDFNVAAASQRWIFRHTGANRIDRGESLFKTSVCGSLLGAYARS